MKEIDEVVTGDGWETFNELRLLGIACAALSENAKADSDIQVFYEGVIAISRRASERVKSLTSRLQLYIDDGPWGEDEKAE
jgi:hypothetical protein